MAIDKVDTKILTYLQENGRMTNTDIAKDLGMAPSGILERIRKLEKRGLITGYMALVDPKAIGLGLIAFVRIRLEGANWSDEFAQRIAAMDIVEEVHSLLGDESYMAKVRAKDMDELTEIVKGIGEIPEVTATCTIMVTQTIKEHSPLRVESSK